MNPLQELVIDVVMGWIAAERLLAIFHDGARLIDEEEFWRRAGMES
ncbi:hypothetical protein [Longimicrobium sp.]|nr:hypothetical protein [Longimicrobium sp.]HSU15971.1 hypothetical protein [Longimicrobium sp.]